MNHDAIKQQVQQIEHKLEELKRNDQVAYERLLAQIGDALEELTANLSAL